jgi:1-acyl-sn-glycerol-3-phosphate acyltransferase
MLLRLSEYIRLYVGLGTLGVLCLLWSVFAVPLYPLLPQRVGEKLGRWTIMRGFWFYLHSLEFIGACRFDLSELDALRDEKEGLILAPNHPSLLDAVMVISKFPNIACIMKSTLMDSIFFGSGARLARYIRNDPPMHMIKQAVHELNRGSFLLLFPEGTRTITPPVNICKPSTGLIAKRAGAPVQTLLIETNSEFLGKTWPLSRRPDMPMIYRIRLGKRFSAPTGDVSQFVADIENYLRDELQRATLQPPMQNTNDATQLAERQPYA